MIREIIERIIGGCKSKDIEKMVDEIDKELKQRFTLAISDIGCEVLIQEFDQHVGSILFIGDKLILNYNGNKFKIEKKDFMKIADILNKG